MRTFSKVAVTGGAGFIGANFIHHMFQEPRFKGKIVNIDKLTYAGNLQNLEGVPSDRYFFEQHDICDYSAMQKILDLYDVDLIVHFAAESHVDRAISGPKDFLNTNVLGTFSLLEAARNVNAKRPIHFHHISTDEVFGSIREGMFDETSSYQPRNPYSASKASSDHLVRSYFHTYNLPVTISNCSNNFGPYQHLEKLIPVVISKIKKKQEIPVYGAGENVRDWVYVTDHCRAISLIVHEGLVGETYNVGANNEWTNIDLVKAICKLAANINNKEAEEYYKLISFVKDRQGHDLRYAVDSRKIKKELDWSPQYDFLQSLEYTLRWYMDKLARE